MMPPPAFWAKVQKTDTCWLWTGKLTNGYGRFGSTGAHRFSYAALKGKKFAQRGSELCITHNRKARLDAQAAGAK